MRIQVRAQNQGHDARFRAGRKFINGHTYEMEVVEADEDPKAADGTLDMTRINKAGFEALKRDPVFSVLAGDAASGPNGAIVDAARRQASDTAAKLSDAQLEISTLKAENATLKARVAELQGHAGEKEAEDKAHKNANKDAGHKR